MDGDPSAHYPSVQGQTSIPSRMASVTVEHTDDQELISAVLQSRKSVGARRVSRFGLSFLRSLRFRQLDSGCHSVITTRAIRATSTFENARPVHVDTFCLLRRMQAGQADWRMAAASARPTDRPLPRPHLQTCGCVPSTDQVQVALSKRALLCLQRVLLV